MTGKIIFDTKAFMAEACFPDGHHVLTHDLERAGVYLTPAAVYHWQRRGNIPVDRLAAVITVRPDIDIKKFIKRVKK